jgi:hypothetical protein
MHSAYYYVDSGALRHALMPHHIQPGSVWVVYLTPKIERVISLLSASPVGEARCRCRKVWLTRIDCKLRTLASSARAKSSGPGIEGCTPYRELSPRAGPAEIAPKIGAL